MFFHLTDFSFWIVCVWVACCFVFCLACLICAEVEMISSLEFIFERDYEKKIGKKRKWFSENPSSFVVPQIRIFLIRRLILKRKRTREMHSLIESRIGHSLNTSLHTASKKIPFLVFLNQEFKIITTVEYQTQITFKNQ